MARYFFNTVNGRRYPDEDGADLPDLEAVRRRATVALAELLKERPSTLWDTGCLRLEVTDQAGAPVLALQVSLDGP